MPRKSKTASRITSYAPRDHPIRQRRKSTQPSAPAPPVASSASAPQSMETDDIPRKIVKMVRTRGIHRVKIPPNTASMNDEDRLVDLGDVMIWTRVSTASQDSDGTQNGQRQYSLDNQKESCVRMSKQLKLRARRWYSFVGSGWKDPELYLNKFKREVLAAMREFNLTKMVVAVRDAARFSRHGDAAVQLAFELKNKYNVWIFSALEKCFLTSLRGVEALHQACADSVLRSKKSRDNWERARLRGDDIGPLPYGKKRIIDRALNRKVRVDDPTEVRILHFIETCTQVQAQVQAQDQIWNLLKEITHTQDNGTILRSLITQGPVDPDTIAKILNRYQVRFRKDREWTEKIVRKVLRSRVSPPPPASSASSASSSSSSASPGSGADMVAGFLKNLNLQ